MTFVLGNMTRKGTVLPKQEAEVKYEEVIAGGDARSCCKTGSGLVLNIDISFN